MNGTDQALVQARGLGVRYRSKQALDDVSFTIPPWPRGGAVEPQRRRQDLAHEGAGGPAAHEGTLSVLGCEPRAGAPSCWSRCATSPTWRSCRAGRASTS